MEAQAKLAFKLLSQYLIEAERAALLLEKISTSDLNRCLSGDRIIVMII